MKMCMTVHIAHIVCVVCVCVCVCVFIFVCMCVFIFVCVCVCVHVCAYTHVCDQELLEETLDKVDHELGSLRMTLKRYQVLKTT